MSYAGPISASYIGNPNGLASYYKGGTGLFIFTSSITDHFGDEPAETRDASGPHPDFDGSLFIATAENSEEDKQSDCPDTSDGYFGGHWFAPVVKGTTLIN